EEERGTALGLNIAASFTGFALGFILGGILSYYLSWRVIFLAIAPVAAVLIGLIRLRLHGECAITRGKRFDIAGMTLHAGMLLCIVAGFSTLPHSLGMTMVTVGAVLLCGYILWEMRATSPIVDIRLLSGNRVYVLANATVLVYNMGTFAVIFLISLYLQYIREFDARLVGIVLLGSNLISAGLVGYAGRLADRTAAWKVASGGIVVTCVGIALLSLASHATPLPLFLAAVFLVVGGYAFFQPPIYSTVIGSIDKAMYGVASGFVETMRLVGMTASMAITIIVFSLYLGSAEITPAHHATFLESFTVIFTFFFILSVGSLAIAIYLGKRVQSPAGRTEHRIRE
ncbi:MAG: MFS transporter, partial [Methanobacteriota archaeon]